MENDEILNFFFGENDESLEFFVGGKLTKFLLIDEIFFPTNISMIRYHSCVILGYLSWIILGYLSCVCLAVSSFYSRLVSI